MSEINFFNESIKYELKQKRALRNWISTTAEKENHRIGDLNFILCSDEHLLSVNKEYLQHDYYTDIITFDYTEDGEINGDIFISLDRVKDNAKNVGVKLADELHRIIIHGVLHLLGFKDKSLKDKEIMTSKEDYYLSLRPFSK